MSRAFHPASNERRQPPRVPPASAPFEEVAERAGITVANCLYVDDSIENLDTAKRLGMATVLIGPSSAEARARGHQHATDLRGLLTRRREMDDAR